MSAESIPIEIHGSFLDAKLEGLRLPRAYKAAAVNRGGTSFIGRFQTSSFKSSHLTIEKW